MKTKRNSYPKFEAYFYNGFSKPKLLATNVTQLLKDVNVSSNYLGDCTSDMRRAVREFKESLDMENFKSDMSDYQILINPTLRELREQNSRWFDKNDLDVHLDDFIK